MPTRHCLLVLFKISEVYFNIIPVSWWLFLGSCEDRHGRVQTAGKETWTKTMQWAPGSGV